MSKIGVSFMLSDIELIEVIEDFLCNRKMAITRYRTPDGDRRGLRGVLMSYDEKDLHVRRPRGEMVDIPLATILEIVPENQDKKRTPGSRRDWHGP